MSIDQTASVVVDAHAHFWRWPAGPGRREAEAVASQAPAAYAHEPISAAQLLDVLTGAGVDKLIQVTRTAMGYDNGYSLEGAAAHSQQVRVLCRYDPFADDLEEQLDQAVDDPLVVGARVHHFPPEDDWLSDGSYERMWSALETRGLAASVYAPNRPDILGAIAARHDGLRLVVDHAGVSVLPDHAPPERFAGWDQVLALARFTNVTLKVSGLPEATEESSFPFPRAQEKLRQAYESFGSERLMWGSNYPPTLRVCSYEDAVSFIRELCDFLTQEDKAAILGGTAARVFALSW